MQSFKTSKAIPSKDLINYINDNHLFFVSLSRYQDNYYSNPLPVLRVMNNNKSLTNNASNAEDVFNSLLEFTVDQSTLDSELESGLLTFYLQTVIGNKWQLANIHPDFSEYQQQDSHALFDVLMSDKEQNIHLLLKHLRAMHKPVRKNKIYVWKHGQWRKNDQDMYERSIEDLVGLDHIYNKIESDIVDSIKHQDTLIKFGISAGLNYLLYGPPGTGKSSLAKALAHELGASVYIARFGGADESDIAAMLIPPLTQFDDFDDEATKTDSKRFSLSNVRFLLLEDFDRLMASGKSQKALSAILNALDGISPAFGVVRLFSANAPEVLSQNEALASRFKNTFVFQQPGLAEIKELVHKVFATNQNHINEEKLQEFLDLVQNESVSMRQITNYICEFLSAQDPLSAMVDGFSDWLTSIKRFKRFAESEDRKKEEAQPPPQQQKEELIDKDDSDDDDVDDDDDDDDDDELTAAFSQSLTAQLLKSNLTLPKISGSCA